MRFQSGIVDEVLYFIAVDITDLATRETGLSSFTVYRDRNGAGAAAMTTPTITEVDSTNMKGVYKLLLDEDMTIGAGNDSEAMVFHITQASMAPVTIQIELYRPIISAGFTLGVASDGDLIKVNTLDGQTAQTGDSFALANGASGFVATNTVVDSILVDTAEIGTAGASLTDLGGMSSGMKTEVNVEALDVLNVDTFAEPTGVPPSTDSIVDKIGFIYMALRNRVDITSSKKKFYDDAGNAEWEKDLTEDGTTYSESEGNAP